jgi:hypothetical protein
MFIGLRLPIPHTGAAARVTGASPSVAAPPSSVQVDVAAAPKIAKDAGRSPEMDDLSRDHHESDDDLLEPHEPVYK